MYMENYRETFEWMELQLDKINGLFLCLNKTPFNYSIFEWAMSGYEKKNRKKNSRGLKQFPDLIFFCWRPDLLFLKRLMKVDQ